MPLAGCYPQAVSGGGDAVDHYDRRRTWWIFPHRMLLAGMALSTAFTMLLMMLQASGDPRMAQVLTRISGSTYNATDAQVWRTGIVMVILLAITRCAAAG